MQGSWHSGDNEFKKEILELVHQRARGYHSGVEIGEYGTKAEWLIAAELKRRDWKELDLRNKAKGDPGKVKLALLLRKQTTMTLKWIAQRLSIGSAGHLSNRLYVHKQNNE